MEKALADGRIPGSGDALRAILRNLESGIAALGGGDSRDQGFQDQDRKMLIPVLGTNLPSGESRLVRTVPKGLAFNAER